MTLYDLARQRMQSNLNRYRQFPWKDELANIICEPDVDFETQKRRAFVAGFSTSSIYLNIPYLNVKINIDEEPYHILFFESDDYSLLETYDWEKDKHTFAAPPLLAKILLSHTTLSWIKAQMDIQINMKENVPNSLYKSNT